MRKIVTIGLFLAAITCFSCNSNKAETVQEEVASLAEEVKLLPQGSAEQKKLFSIESAYVKYINHAAGQVLIREWWFDQYGSRQLDENYMVIMDEKAGGYSLISDGFRYNWNYDGQEGTKMKFYSSAYTDYENVSDKDIERYGIEKHGYEVVAGKRCLKLTTQKPVKATMWMWEGIPLKTISEFSGNEVVMEATEINTDNIEPSRFQLPENITFTDF